ncbi:MAG: hypothetical protein LWW80_08840, partial [Thiomonas sp.]|nr:hypothetical protein [Thiomonas sp.]
AQRGRVSVTPHSVVHIPSDDVLVCKDSPPPEWGRLCLELSNFHPGSFSTVSKIDTFLCDRAQYARKGVACFRLYKSVLADIYEADARPAEPSAGQLLIFPRRHSGEWSSTYHH